MDRSYWSKENVVRATRNFVCIRLATYEDKGEVEFLTSVFRGRSGKLENTVFALLDSDGKKKLVRSGRSPDFAFFGDRRFVEGLNRIAKLKRSEEKKFTDQQLPLAKNLDLGLNIAACDRIQLIVITGRDQATVEKLCQTALPLAWNDEIGGQFVFAKATKDAELKPLGLDTIKNGLIVVEPGKFGMSGKVIANFGESFDIKDTQDKLAKLAAGYQVDKNYRQHIQAGIRLGIEWETETPVTDQQSLRAKERARGR